MSIYMFLIFAVGIIISIGIGIEIGRSIDEFILYILFWFLYIITIITFINIILVAKYYMSMRNKTGVPGVIGIQGDQGDKGETGKCNSDCRDKICENALNELLINEIKTQNKGVRVNLNNIYIKSKIKQMCDSDEFKQLAPYNGPINLINYLKDIWKLWIKLLYDSGGILYFETIGAEDQFEWLLDNPFDELKKYDVFYWGMGKQYRPQISEKCYNSDDGNNPNSNSSGSIIQVVKTNFYDKITSTNKSGAYMSASVWRAKKFTYKSAVFYPVGDIIIGPTLTGDTKTSKKYIGNIAIKYDMQGPDRETILVSGDIEPPINYELLWTNYGWSTNSSQPNYFWVWRPIAPVNYIALGDIITQDANPPLTGDEAPIRCVPFNMVVKIPTNTRVLWSSFGSSVDINLILLGFIPNIGGKVELATEQNAYNLCRGVLGTDPNIPESDVNANFYYLDRNKYNADYIFGADSGIPNTDSESNRVGKGFIPSQKQDSKYSVIAYLNLKNNPVLKHSKTKITINGEIIPNAISNTYILKFNKQCIDYKKTQIILTTQCDELVDSQYFSIIFTGNKKNECKLKHYKTNKILKYKNKKFSLLDENNFDDAEYTLFMMS